MSPPNRNYGDAAVSYGIFSTVSPQFQESPDAYERVWYSGLSPDCTVSQFSSSNPCDSEFTTRGTQHAEQSLTLYSTLSEFEFMLTTVYHKSNNKM